ncbi:MAG: hypothetical protein EAZ15_03420 [Sphingobacteriales bacterium]|nr:MAG: hypothetical protein EAZ15_03420 [Sphingobacteriales bacterium]
MNLQQFEADKLNIINWINHLQDFDTVEKVKSLMPLSNVFELTEAQKNAIDEALISLETSKAIPHELVMKETKERFGHLFNR